MRLEPVFQILLNVSFVGMKGQKSLGIHTESHQNIHCMTHKVHIYNNLNRKARHEVYSSPKI